MGINIVSRYWFYEKNEEETVEHLFLTVPIANRLWREFAIFIGINMKDIHLQ